MEITENKQNDVTIFCISGSLDSDTSPQLEEKIFETIAGGANKFVVDCGELSYISSAGLRVLNKTTKKLKHNDGKIVLCSMRDYIQEVFQIAGFDYFITIVPNLDAAMKAIDV